MRYVTISKALHIVVYNYTIIINSFKLMTNTILLKGSCIYKEKSVKPKTLGPQWLLRFFFLKELYVVWKENNELYLSTTYLNQPILKTIPEIKVSHIRNKQYNNLNAYLILHNSSSLYVERWNKYPNSNILFSFNKQFL